MAVGLAISVIRIDPHDKHPFSDWNQAAYHAYTAWIASLPHESIITLDLATHHHQALRFCVWYRSYHYMWLLPVDDSFVSWWRRTLCRGCWSFQLLADCRLWAFDLLHPLGATNDALVLLTVFSRYKVVAKSISFRPLKRIRVMLFAFRIFYNMTMMFFLSGRSPGNG